MVRKMADKEFITKEFITKVGLKKRGWTEAAISRFVPDCDQIAPNPRFEKGEPIKLYLLVSIEHIEQSNEFKEFAQTSDKWEAVAAKAAETKKHKLLAYIEGWEIVVTSEPLDKVRCDAIDAYNGHQDWICEPEFREIRFATKDSDPNFLDRITVNYLRHQLSDYGNRLVQLGPTGKDEAYKALRDKIFLAIAERYPELATECRRQVFCPDIIRSLIP